MGTKSLSLSNQNVLRGISVSGREVVKNLITTPLPWVTKTIPLQETNIWPASHPESRPSPTSLLSSFFFAWDYNPTEGMQLAPSSAKDTQVHSTLSPASLWCLHSWAPFADVCAGSTQFTLSSSPRSHIVQELIRIDGPERWGAWRAKQKWQVSNLLDCYLTLRQMH